MKPVGRGLGIINGTGRSAALALMLAAATLTGCGNDAGNNDMKSVLQGITQRGLKVGDKGSQSAPDIGQMLAGTKGPLRLIAFASDGAVAGVQQIEANGPYRTFATADRRTVTFKSGMVTGTRGLGDDLMSADVDAALALVRSRKPGRVARVMRFLDGAGTTRAMRFDCTVTPGSWGKIANGSVSGRVQLIEEYCQGEVLSFNNRYSVTAGGEILSSSQWLSALRGMADITVLRR